MSPRTRKQFEDIREEKRDLIINAALRLFADTGYHATSISKIAKEASISKGLMYNYFESKEDLLISIMDLFVIRVGLLINPDSDDEITTQEMEDFFELMVESMRKDNELWRLHTQLSFQKEVFALAKESLNTEASQKHQQLILKYFRERFENPEEEMLFFTSLLKGFTVMYLFTPEMFPNDIVSAFILRMKKLFIKEKL